MLQNAAKKVVVAIGDNPEAVKKLVDASSQLGTLVVTVVATNIASKHINGLTSKLMTKATVDLGEKIVKLAQNSKLYKLV